MSLSERPAYEPLDLPHRAEMGDAEMLAASEAFLRHMKERHTVRDFSARPVPEAIVVNCIAAAGRAPSGANRQPWHFVAISDPAMKARIRVAAEAEEQRFYAGGAGDEWLLALEPVGTNASKPHLEESPWLVVVFAERHGRSPDGRRVKNYYVQESVGIASGFLLAGLHRAGLACLTHTPNPMRFLNRICGRPESEKPVMIVAVGHPSADARVPAAAKIKKPVEEILSVYRE